MKKIERNVEASMPPATEVPTELRAPAPAPVATASGSTPRMKANDVIRIGPQPDAAGLDRGVEDRQAALAQLLGELDDQDRVLGREADQHDEADLAEDVVGEPAQQLRAQAAEDGQGHAEQDDERQHPALVLRGQHQVHEDQAEREDVDRLRARLDLLERLAGPGEVESRRQRSRARSAPWPAAPGPSSRRARPRR